MFYYLLIYSFLKKKIAKLFGHQVHQNYKIVAKYQMMKAPVDKLEYNVLLLQYLKEYMPEGVYE